MAAVHRVEAILRRVAEVEGIKHCEIRPDPDVLNGDGIGSEAYKGSIESKDPGAEKTVKVFIKVKHSRDIPIIHIAFVNEVAFYSKLYPSLESFQRQQGVKEVFDKIPKYFCGSLDQGQEYLAFSDLIAENYVLFEKSQVLDQKHLELIFAAYGKFHALTFAFKASNPEKHQELVKPFGDTMVSVMMTSSKSAKENFQTALEYIKENNGQGLEKIQWVIDNFDTIRSKSYNYEGKHAAWIHGDCWSNNMLFKYRANGDLDDLKLLDHQCGRDSTPVHDLSYFFYSGASKSDFDKLDYYLDLYYKSFSGFARELGADPHQLLPFEALKTDWNRYAFFGIFMGMIVWDFKFIARKEFQEVIADKDEGKDLLEQFLERGKKGRQHPLHKKMIADILVHAVEYGIIQ